MFLKGVVGSAALPDAGGTTKTGLCRLESNGLGDRAETEAVEPRSLAGSQHDQVGPARARVQQDHACRIAVLDAHVEPHAGRLRGLAQ